MANGKRQETAPLKYRWEQTRDYLRAVYNELKKVHWPNRNQLVAYTTVVLVAVGAVALLIWVFDSALSYLLELLFAAVR
ncbi:MAG: preprotein translocase subunit SecE [Syntrophomonadaceae bacterium]|nr:preprotein translocase subunit SecE [Syntrophomonadaceae bacterium]MDH7497777.1 preprotein translocase subunit SecE [Syntrophomonadaceae bacterium]